ncbi:MAG: RDD family protein [Dehalococcoidia bacterium]
MAGRLAAVGRDNADDAAETAGLGPRLAAYLLDSVVLGVFALIFAIAAGAIIFFSSDGGESNPSDEAFSALVIVILLTMPAWFLFALALFWKRGQSIGQYLMGIEITRDDGKVPGNGQIAAYLICLHPLLFHPVMAVLWAYAAYQSLIHSSLVLLIVGIAMALLSILGPLASLAFALTDSRRRGIHDRLAGMRVIRVLYGE